MDARTLSPQTCSVVRFLHRRLEDGCLDPPPALSPWQCQSQAFGCSAQSQTPGFKRGNKISRTDPQRMNEKKKRWGDYLNFYFIELIFQQRRWGCQSDASTGAIYFKNTVTVCKMMTEMLRLELMSVILK